MGTIRQIAFLDMPDGAVGHGGSTGWANSFDLPTLPGSTILIFTQIAATNGPVITGVTDSNGNAHTLLDNLRNTSNGAEYWSAIKQNCPSIPAGFSGRAGSGTSTTLTDDTLTARGVTWATNQFAGEPYINHNSGWTGTVISNTSNTLTISGMGGAPQPFEFYSVGGYLHTTLTGSGDYFGSIAVEVSGVAASSLINHDKVQNSYNNGDVISCPTHALGSSPGTMLACCLNDTDVNFTPAVGSGFTDDGSYMKWDQAGKMARLQHQLLSNPGTAGATFVATGTSHYQALYVALLDAPAAAALGGGGTSSSSATGGLTTGIKLVGAPASTATATGTLSGAGSPAALAGNPNSPSSATGALSTAILFAGAPVSVSSATGDLNRLIAAATIASTGSGALSTAIKLAVSAISSSSGSGAMGAGIALAAAASTVSSAAAALTNYVTVTLTNPLYTGQGSVLDARLWPGSMPGVGSTLLYDGRFITIAPDGSISSTSNNCSAVVEFNDGTKWQTGVIYLTSGMVGYADSVATATGVLTTAIRLLGAANALVSATASLNAQITLRGAAAAVSAATADLATQILLSAPAFDDSAASGSLTGTNNQLSGNATSSSFASGFLNAQIQLAAAAASLVAATGVLATQIRLVATALSTASASASLGTGTQLQAFAASASAGSASLLTQIRMAGAATELSAAAAVLSTQIKLLGAALSSTDGSGDLSTSTGLAAAAQSVSTGSAQLTTLITFSSQAFSTLSATGQLTTSIQLEADAADNDFAAGLLTATGSPVGLYVADPFFLIGQRRTYFTDRFPQVSPQQAAVLSFNFSDELVNGETLQGIIHVSVVASAGQDPSLPASLFNGEASYDQTLSEVLQPFHDPLPDTDYYFTVTAPTTNPMKVLTRFGILSCRG